MCLPRHRLQTPPLPELLPLALLPNERLELPASAAPVPGAAPREEPPPRALQEGAAPHLVRALLAH